jgi:hypothetical protein
MPRRIVGAWLVATLVCGCPNPGRPIVSSQDRDTKDLQPRFLVWSDGTTLHAHAEIGVGYFNDVRLEGGDVLVVKYPDRRTQLAPVENPNGEEISYEGSLPSPPPGTRVTFELDRPPGKVSAPGSFGDLPAPFTIVDYVPTAAHAGETLTFHLDGAGASVAPTVSGPCVAGSGAGQVPVGADGSVAFSMGQVYERSPADCTVTWALSVVNRGSLDPAFNPNGAVEPVTIAQTRQASVKLLR